MNTSDEFIPTRQSLLSRLKNRDDQEGWQVFFDTYWRLIYRAALKAGLSDAEAQDVVQETVLSVLKSMPTFEYDVEKGSFKGWLLRLTKWRIIDHLRLKKTPAALRYNGSRTSTDTTEIERVADPASLNLDETWNKEWEQNLFEAAIGRIKKKVDSKHYQVFDLHVLKSWPVSKVARTLGIRAGKVYLIKHRINNLIKKEIDYLRTRPI